MKKKYIQINEEVISTYCLEGKSKLLHKYAVLTYLTAGYGYISISDLENKVSEFCSVSKKTVGRWISDLKKNNLIRIKKGVIYIKGRKHLENGINTTQTYIKFYEEHLTSYLNLQVHVIDRQLF